MKDDKKKVMVVGVLFVAMIGIGAFTMLGGSSTPPPAAKSDKKDDAKVAAEKAAAEAAEEAPKNPLYAAELPQRDPFEPRAIEGNAPKQANVPPATNPLPNPTKVAHRNRGGGSNLGTVAPVGWEGGAIPNPNGLNGGIGIAPSGPDPSAFGYNVTGTLMGARPVAVFSDSQGNQRMVPVGGSLDGDSKVISISKGQVTVSHRGKTLRLPLGGTPK